MLPRFTRGRRVTGVLNNPTAEERAHFVGLCTDDGHDPRIKYLVFQSEVGRSGTHHLQYFCIFNTVVRARQAHGILGRRVAFDRTHGTPAQNKHYCLKPHVGCTCQKCRDARVLPNDGREVAPQFITGEWGRFRAPRSDSLSEIVAYMAPGTATLKEVLDQFPEQAIKYGDRIIKEFARRMPVRDWAMEIEIFVGDTGTGKSTTAKVENPDHCTIPWPTGGRWWWPGYTGQDTVILDEFRMQVKMDVFLKLFDRHEWSVEAKGSNFPFVSKKIVITTNIDPKDWYQMVGLVERKGQQARHDVLKPLARRIQEFAKIYDFAPGHAYPNFVKVLRPMPAVFTFNDSVVRDFRANRVNDGYIRGDQYANGSQN